MTENKKFPGRENYTGPKSGYFAFVHHGVLLEESHDIFERLEYVDKHKPANEIAVRRWNMLYLDPALCPAAAKCAPLDADYVAKRDSLDADYEAKCASLYADYEAKCASLYADYKAKYAPLDADYVAKCAPLYADYKAKRAPLDADYEAKRDSLYAEILAYIRREIPDCAWHEKLKSLVFPTGE